MNPFDIFNRSLADTDSDGKMDINEFSIACKLINLKLRGYEIPKGIPPSLLASLKVHTPPAIPPLPTLAAKTVGVPPPRPEPPKAAPMINSQPLMQTASMLPSQPLLPQVTPTQPLVAGLVGIPPTTGMVPPPVAGIPTGTLYIINNPLTTTFFLLFQLFHLQNVRCSAC